MSNNSNRRESIFASDRDPKDENPDQIPSIQYTSTLKELDQRPSDSFFPIATANTLAVGSPKGIFGSCLEISDMPSLNALQTESKGATTTASLNPSQNTIDDHTPLPPKGLKKPNLPLDPRRPLIKNKFQKMNSFKLARPPGINSPTASEAQGLIAGSSTPTGYSSLGRRMFEERRKEQGITERDSLEEEWDERKGPRPAGKRWRKVMVMMQALSKMKKNPKGPEVELSQKQLELLYDFGTHQEPKSSVTGKKRLSQQDSIRINHSNSGLPLLSGQESSRGTSVWDLIRRVGRLVLRRKERILPEGIAREAMRKEGKSKLEGFWVEMRKPFSPSDKFRLRWDMLLMFLVVIDMIILPLQISFSIFGAALEYQYTTDVIFIFDILLTFHTGYYLHGDLVTNHKDIAKSYAKSWLVVDFISAFPFHAIEEAQYTDQDPASSLRKPSFLKLFRILRIVKVLRALRFFKLSKIFWKFKVFFGYSQAHSFFQLLKLIIIVLLLTHWLACIWHMVAVFELEFTDNNTWLNSRGLLDADSAERYINSLYWAVTTILTVGYGDITPVSIPELWCAVFSMFFACGVFAYSLNTIGGIINDISESRAKVSWKIYAINKFMQKKNMAKGLQERVRGYMEHLLEEENTRKHDQEEFLAMMPEHLKKDILMDLNGRLLTENPIFSSNFTLKFLQELATKLQEKSFGPGENIYTENDKNQESSFFIVTKGKVQLYLQKTNQSLKTLMAEEYFGEVSFFSDNKRTISARSANYSHLFYLEKNGFLEILEHLPQEKEAYCEIRDKANLYNDFSSLRVRCLACNRENHCTQSCPQLQYMPDYQYIIQLVRNEDKRFRASFMRRERKKFNALNEKAQIHDATEKFRDDLLGLPMPRVYSRNSSLTFKPENKPKRSQTDLSFDSDHLLEEDKEDKFENECNKPELLSLIEEEDIIDDHSHVLVLSPKSMTLKFKELSQYAEIMKTEANKSYMKKKKKSEIVFEKIQIFSRYFVHNNIDNVISRINRLNQRKENVSKQDKNNRRGSTTDTLELSAVRGKSGKSRPLLLNSLSSLPGFLKKLKHGSETLD